MPPQMNNLKLQAVIHLNGYVNMPLKYYRTISLVSVFFFTVRDKYDEKIWHVTTVGGCWGNLGGC